MRSIPAGAAVLVVVGIVLAGCAARSEAGPIDPVNDHGYGGIVVPAQSTFTDGFEILTVSGDAPVTIESVSLVDTDPGLELVAIRFAGERRSQGDGQQFQRSVRAEITVCTPDAVDPVGSCPMVEE